MSIAAFALFLAVPVWAQHGGGHGGGGFGGHGGFGGGHAAVGGGHFGGRHVSGGMRSAPAFSRPFTRPPAVSQRGFSRGPFLHSGVGIRIRSYGFRNNCFGYPCYGYPGEYGGYYYPWWWYDDPSYDDSYSQNVAEAAEMNRESLEEQRMLRQEQADGDQDIYARAAPAPRSATGDEKPGTSFLPDTVLVFRDQHKEEIQNYAIVGQTLWNFAPQHTEKIALADLDLAATTKTNEDRGVTFRIPSRGEAQ